MYSKSKELMVDDCSKQSLLLQLDRPLLGIFHLEGSDALILLTNVCRRKLWSLHRLDSDQLGNSLRHGNSDTFGVFVLQKSHFSLSLVVITPSSGANLTGTLGAFKKVEVADYILQVTNVIRFIGGQHGLQHDETPFLRFLKGKDRGLYDKLSAIGNPHYVSLSTRMSKAYIDQLARDTAAMQNRGATLDELDGRRSNEERRLLGLPLIGVTKAAHEAEGKSDGRRSNEELSSK
jgi:hypothetical protein